jgi:hypothetical protein
MSRLEQLFTSSVRMTAVGPSPAANPTSITRWPMSTPNPVAICQERLLGGGEKGVTVLAGVALIPHVVAKRQWKLSEMSYSAAAPRRYTFFHAKLLRN